MKPTDLPIMQADKFELVINLKAAKALGITIGVTSLAFPEMMVEVDVTAITAE